MKPVFKAVLKNEFKLMNVTNRNVCV